MATVIYLANGSKDFPKERIEIFADGKILVCDNFRVSKHLAAKRNFKTKGQDKGHANELQAFIDCIGAGKSWPIPGDQLVEVSAATIDAAIQTQQTLAKLS